MGKGCLLCVGKPEVARLRPARSQHALPFVKLQVGISVPGSASIPRGPAGFPACPWWPSWLPAGVCKSQRALSRLLLARCPDTQRPAAELGFFPAHPAHPRLADRLPCSSGLGEWPSSACSTISRLQSCLSSPWQFGDHTGKAKAVGNTLRSSQTAL